MCSLLIAAHGDVADAYQFNRLEASVSCSSSQLRLITFLSSAVQRVAVYGTKRTRPKAVVDASAGQRDLWSLIDSKVARQRSVPQPRILEGHRVGSCFVAGVAINQIGRKPYRPPLRLDPMVRRSAGAGCELHEPLGCLYLAMTDRMQLIRRPGRRAFGCFSFNRPPALANQATPATPPADQVRAPLGHG